MWKAASGVLLLHYMTSLTSCAAECHKDGPQTCFFQNKAGSTFCSWSKVNFGFKKVSTIGFLELVPGKETGNLTSRTACSTDGRTECLWFAYRFSASDVFDLSVSITVGDKAESLLWISSSGNGWREASVPINTTDNFTIIFRAKKRCGEKAVVGLDNMRYYKSPGEEVYCRLLPSSALPRLGTTQESSRRKPAITRTHPFTTMPTTKNRPPSTKTPITNITHPSTKTPITKRTHPSTITPAASETAEQSNNTVTVAVTIVFGVVGVLIIVVVVLCVLKQQHRRQYPQVKNEYEMPSQKAEYPDTGEQTGPSTSGDEHNYDRLPAVEMEPLSDEYTSLTDSSDDTSNEPSTYD